MTASTTHDNHARRARRVPRARGGRGCGPLGAAALLMMGCGDASSPGSGNDGGQNPTPDAAADDDAGAFVTDCVPDGPPGAVTVDLMPYFGNPPIVLVHAQDGSLLSQTEVADSATIDVEVPSCGMVTLASFAEFTEAPHLLTWVDVQPGHHLARVLAPRYSFVPIEVSFAALAGATEYTVSTTGDQVTVSDSPVQLDGRSRDGEVSAFATTTVDGQFFWSGATATVSGPTTTQLSLDTWSQSVIDVSPTLSALPAEVSRVTAIASLVPGDGFMPIVITDASAVDGAAALAPMLVPDGFSPAQLLVQLDQPDSDHVAIARLPAAAATAMTYDDFLPMPISFDIVGNLPRPTIHWTAAASVADADLVMIEAETGPDWVVIAPAATMTVRYPEVPAALVPVEIRPDTVALAAIGDTADYGDALARLPEVNQIYFVPSQASYRISLLGDLDPAVIEPP